MSAGTLAGQRVVVVGGTSGMGAATVDAARRAGADVVVAGRRPADDDPDRAVVDVTDEASIRALFEQVGAFDHLLITATAGRAGPLRERDRSVMDGKFFAGWLCASYAADRIRAGGSITFVTGAGVLRPPPDGALFAAALAALETLGKGLAVELAPVRVNTIRPGFTDSEMWDYMSAEQRVELRRRVAEAMPVRRMGTPDDIAAAAVFLMSSPQITGTVLEVTGGEQLVPEVEIP